MTPIRQDKFQPGDRIRVLSGEFMGCTGAVMSDRHTYMTERGLMWGYAVELDGAGEWRVASEFEIEWANHVY